MAADAQFWIQIIDALWNFSAMHSSNKIYLFEKFIFVIENHE